MYARPLSGVLRRYDAHDCLTFCYSGFVVTMDSMHLHIYQKFIGTVYTVYGLDQKLDEVIALCRAERAFVSSSHLFPCSSLFGVSVHFPTHLCFPYISSSSPFEIETICSG
jgi:hypothetical protein